MGKRVERLMTELLIIGDGKKMGKKGKRGNREKRGKGHKPLGRIGKERRRQEMEGRQVTADDKKR